MSVIIKSGASGNLLTIDGTSGAARNTLYDTSGTAISNVTIAGALYVGNAFLQNEFTSVNNSSTTNLASAASFTGTSDALLGRDCIQVSFFADQQCTIQVQQAQQSPGTSWDVVDTYVIAASTGDSRTFKAIGSAVRVIVTNNGGSTTTALRLQTVLTPVSNAVPRALTSLGNMKVAIAESNVTKWSYCGCVNNLTPPATPTDMATITGSATRTIKVTRVIFSSTQTTAGINTFFLVKRSTANSGGTSTSPTIVPLDSTNPAATATVLQYTANPAALGTVVGNVRASKLITPATTSLLNPEWIWEFDLLNTQPIVLRGTGQVLALNFAGAALPAGLNVNCAFHWTEEL